MAREFRINMITSSPHRTCPLNTLLSTPRGCLPTSDPGVRGEDVMHYRKDVHLVQSYLGEKYLCELNTLGYPSPKIASSGAIFGVQNLV